MPGNSNSCDFDHPACSLEHCHTPAQSGTAMAHVRCCTMVGWPRPRAGSAMADGLDWQCFVGPTNFDGVSLQQQRCSPLQDAAAAVAAVVAAAERPGFFLAGFS